MHFTWEEFRDFAERSDFDSLYNKWKDSGFLSYLAPSVDRIDNSDDYKIDNIQFLTRQENSRKDHTKDICKRGHKFTEENIKRDRQGNKECRKCIKMYSKLYHQKHREKHLAYSKKKYYEKKNLQRIYYKC